MVLQKQTALQTKGLSSITIEPPRKINDVDVDSYLGDLSSRLEQLLQILERERKGFVVPYVSIVKATIDSLKLKHMLTGDDKLDFTLTISPKESGFPTSRDLYSLEKNKSEAEEVLSNFPSREEIIDRIRSAIMRNGSIVNAQTLLHRRNFYTELLSKRVLESFHFGKPEFVKEESGRRLYTLEWGCLERLSNIPVFYRVCLTQDHWRAPLHEQSNDKLKMIAYQTQLGIIELGALARAIDNNVDEVHPKMVARYKIGPYYNSLTSNTPEMEKTINGAEEPSILKFTVEAVLSDKVKQYGNLFDYFWRRKTEREVFGPVDSETKMIVPFRVKQELGNTDEYGKACKVYGVTKGGDIVG